MQQIQNVFCFQPGQNVEKASATGLSSGNNIPFLEFSAN